MCNPGGLANSRRYVALDGLRGLAAIAVALFHLDPELVPSGYLAVDFFFVLSGFILTVVYEGQFAGGLTWRRFMALRAARLYPLFLVGMALSSAFVIQGILRNSTGHMPLAAFVRAAAFNYLMLPSPFDGEMFPFNPPAWSLMAEVAANFAMGIWLIRLRSGLVWVMAAAVVALWFLDARATGGGMTLLHGLVRTLVSFTAGMLVARVTGGRRGRPGWPALLPLAALALLLCCQPGSARRAYDLVVVLVAFPAIVLLASRHDLPRIPGVLAAFIGEVSYALYSVHTPIVHAVQFAGRALHLPAAAVPPLFVATGLALAWITVVAFDVPVRRLLARGALRRVPALAG